MYILTRLRLLFDRINDDDLNDAFVALRLSKVNFTANMTCFTANGFAFVGWGRGGQWTVITVDHFLDDFGD